MRFKFIKIKSFIYLSGIFLAACILLIISRKNIFGKPFQLIESESAVLNRKGSFEKKANCIYETGFIPVYLGRFRVRYGLFRRLEAGVNMDYAYFPDQQEKRVSEVGGTLKGHIRKVRFNDFNLFGYINYRHMLGEPVTTYINASDEGLDENIIGMVSPYADKGRDISIGLLGRNSFVFRRLFGRKRIIYLLGLTYTRLEGRDYGDFNENQKNQLIFNLSPEYHFYHDKIMAALENKITYWHERGYFYTVIPQLRWEFIRFWVLEIGIGLPVIGERNFRFIVGINQGAG